MAVKGDKFIWPGCWFEIYYRFLYQINLSPLVLFTLQTLPARDDSTRTSDHLAKAAGFSLHAGVAVEPEKRRKLERLARYITRPAISEQRLSLTANGFVRYQLKTPYRDGTTHMFFVPIDKIAGSDFEQP